MSSIFTKIIAGEIPCYKIAENENCLAFLDINPVQKGHCLIIPKIEVDYIFDVEDDLLSEMMLFSKKVSKDIKTIVPCNRLSVAVIGLEVPHAHIHLIPITHMSDLDFGNKKQFPENVMKDLAKSIASEYTINNK